MDYKSTLNLPQTAFPMKAGLPDREPETVEHWEKTGLYARILAKNQGRPVYTLHDGPPYANGDIHYGHVLNKVLKDIVVKSRNMSGFQAAFVPGWDCHGLPIELNIEREMGSRRQVTPLEFRRRCREFAGKYMEAQRNSFKRLLILGDWEHPYLTMDPGYEAQTAREFGEFVRRGSVYLGAKPVYWCKDCGTALAEAEVEYEEKTSPSIYVRFAAADDLLARLPAEWRAQKISVVIWTTTPWTLPANLAIALNPEVEYVGVSHGGEVLILARDLVVAVAAACGLNDFHVLGAVDAKALEGAHVRHPFIERESLIVLGDHVTTADGTGCVHTAPGHGLDDYYVCQRYGIDAYNPVDNDGKFMAEAGDWLKGLGVFEANPKIVDELAGRGALFNKKGETIRHRYPHCWRHHTPLIFRSTRQVFLSIDHGDLRKNALAEIDRVTWIPAWGRERIVGMIANRPDWCLSRQRSWGVNLPVFHCEDCETTVMDADIIDRVAGFYEREGGDAWYTHNAQELLPEGYACKNCGGGRFRKENSVVDVWFDSGVSWSAVVRRAFPGLIPVDLYLEGSDQHRGWFHSSLLCAVGTTGRAPYKAVLTHGFVVDSAGKAFSKSAIAEAKRLGLKMDYMDPPDVLKKYGAEILRLWVASEDYRNDVHFSETLLTRISESYRKIRNTLRFLLGNVSDFDPARDAVPHGELAEMDRWLLAKLDEYAVRVRKAYDQYEFHLVYQLTIEFCSVTLSAVYLDINKDRLYASAKNWKARRSAQTAIHQTAEGLCVLLAPILSHTAAEAWSHLHSGAEGGGAASHVLLQDFPAPRERDESALLERWERLLVVRGVVLKHLEEARAQKQIGSSQEAHVEIRASGGTLELLRGLEAFAAELCITSTASVVEDAAVPADPSQVKVTVSRAGGEKCPRCWNYRLHQGSDPHHPGLCLRCTRAVTGGAEP